MSKIDRVAEVKEYQEFFKVPTTRESVLEEIPKWADFSNTPFATQNQLEIVQKFEEEKHERANGVVVEENSKRIQEYLETFFALLNTIHTTETVRYIVLMINLIYEQTPDACSRIIKEVIGSNGLDSLIKLFTKDGCDWFIKDESSLFVGIMIGLHPQLLTKEMRHQLYTFLCAQLSLDINTNACDVRSALHCLMKILFSSKNREPFIHKSKFKILVNIANSCLVPNKFQFVYEAFYCIWLLSFEPHVQTNPHSDIIHVVVKALKLLQKEKITRISLAILKNLSSQESNKNRMIECQLMKLLPQLQARKTADIEIEADLELLINLLDEQANAMSTWESYRHAVLGGELDWAPVHKSENFWKENPFRFEENNNEVLLSLKNILLESKDNTSISVACFDVGEFVLAHPNGKSIVSKLAIKDALMKHLLSTDPEVKRNAVLAYQKVVLQGWETASVNQ